MKKIIYVLTALLALAYLIDAHDSKRNKSRNGSRKGSSKYKNDPSGDKRLKSKKIDNSKQNKSTQSTGDNAWASGTFTNSSNQSTTSTDSKVVSMTTTSTSTTATVTADATGSSDSGSTTSSGSGDSGNSSSSGSGEGKTLTKGQFDKCVAAYAESGMGTPPAPSAASYEAYKKYVVAQMPTFEEQAMFLANCIWETGGLQFVEEIACKTGTCEYGKYFGRGYIQLTWDYNYKAASQDLFKDDRLVEKPETVATPEVAWQTAIWYWKKMVRAKVDDATIKAGDLGATVKVINGALECAGSPGEKAQKRLSIYNGIRKVMALSGSGNLNGCK